MHMYGLDIQIHSKDLSSSGQLAQGNTMKKFEHGSVAECRPTDQEVTV